jgi:glycine betaine/proline transport system substrate-binding protein
MGKMSMKKSIGKLGMAMALAIVLVIAGCGQDSGGSKKGFEHITGIEAGSGVVGAAEKAVDAYNLDVEVVPSSSAAMAASLQAAIEKEEWIVVTGWTPHWKFAAFDLKYLEDPEGVFGGEETINTIVRKGLKEDHPEAYQVLDYFKWSTTDMETIMLDIYENDTDPKDAAQKWINDNRELVDSWIEGVNKVDQVPFDLVYVAWDSEIASTNMIALVLEEVGYKVEITPVDNTPMWQAIANGTHDAMVAAWLPGTHGEQYEMFKDQIVDLGPNLEGAKIGLVVPAYVEIDSIADIKKR